MPTFGEKLKAQRELTGVSGWKIEKLTGISAANLSSIEKGRRPPSDEVLRKLASIPELQISYNQLRAWMILGQATPEELQYLKSELEKME